MMYSFLFTYCDGIVELYENYASDSLQSSLLAPVRWAETHRPHNPSVNSADTAHTARKKERSLYK